MERLTRRCFIRNAAIATGFIAATPVLAACGATPPGPAATQAPAQPTPTAAPATGSGQTTPTAEAAAKPSTPAAKAPAAKEPVTLRFHMRSGTENSEPGIYVRRPEEWSQETGHQVKLEPIPGNEYLAKLLALAAGGTIGDVTWTNETPNNFHSRFVKAGIIEPVDPYLSAHNISKDEWIKPAVDTLTFEGKMYGLPKNSHPGTVYIFVNLKLFEEAGLGKPPTSGATFDDVLNWAIKLSKGPADRREVYGYAAHVSTINGITSGIRRFGGDVIDAEGVSCLADTDPWWEWANWHNRVINVERVHPSTEAQGSQGVAGLFAAEKLAMIHHERSVHKQVQIAVGDKFPWTTIEWPGVANARGWPAIIATHSGTSASKYKEEAFTLVYALADRRMAQITAEDEGYLTARVDNMEAIGDLADDEFIKLQYEAMVNEEPCWRPKNLRGSELQTAITNEMDRVWLGQRQLDREFMVEVKNAVDVVLAKPE